MILNLLLLAASVSIFWSGVDFAIEGKAILASLTILAGMSLLAITIITWGDE
jgi:hypothetical protein